MTGLVRTLLKFAFGFSILYFVFFSVFILKDNEIGMVYENNTGKYISSFSGKYNVVWYGLQPWAFGIEKIAKDRSYTFDLKVLLPGLTSVENDIYFIKVPVRIDCSLIYSDRFLLEEEKPLEGLKSMIYQMSVLSVKSAIMKYSETGYNREVFVKNEAEVKKDIISYMKNNSMKKFLVIKDVEILGPLYLPDMNTYREGLALSREMKNILLENKRKLISIQSELKIQKDRDDQYYVKLKKMSDIIRDNPEILKYIYIDKMSPNIKVIISSDKTGLPSLFDAGKEKNADKNGDIDNLR